MRNHVLATCTLAALALLFASAAEATTFEYNGRVDTFTVAVGGTYEIDAWGAQGGSFDSLPAGQGGLGAMVGGQLYLNAGDTLSVVVGGVGHDINANTGSGGGGGSFVFISADLQLLLAAGGGGGSGWYTPAGLPGLAGRDGGNGGIGAGGAAGNGGGAGGTTTSPYASSSGGGAGWLGPGQSGQQNGDGYGIYGTGGFALYSFQGGQTYGCVTFDECEQGASGGFGGGGGASYNYGGGGGGYSGGGAGGGGGGSYISNEFNRFSGASGVHSGNGLVMINLLPVPEPATWAMMLVGFFSLGAVLRSRRRPAAA